MRDSQLPTFVLRSRRVVTPDGMRDAAIVAVGGIIAGVEEPQNISADVHVDDVGDLVVSPGLVDPHVHINEPGRTEWEGFETATRSAAAGGITTLVDMPLNSSPVTTSLQSLTTKLSATKGKLRVDCGFHAGLVPEIADTLKPLLNAGVLGVKAFMIDSGIDDFPATTEKDFRKAMPAIAESGLPVLVHAELFSPVVLNASSSVARSGAQNNCRSYSHYLALRPRKWENDAIALMLRLCKEFGCRVHIVHLSSSEAITLLQEAKSAGVAVTVETCPHYLFFSAEEIPEGDTRFKCAPPIREHENREKLWRALEEGVIDFVTSDHSPCPPEMKVMEAGDFTKAWGGIASLQFGLPIMWTEARKRGFGLVELSRWLSSKPSKLVGLDRKKGAIAAGYDADFVVWNPDESFVVAQSSVHHRHKITPYDGRTLLGKVHTTFVRGKKVFDQGEFSTPSGRILLREQ